jgi:uroporphyrinogen-III synthase
MAKYKVLSTKKLLPLLIEEAKRNNIQIIEQEFISVQPIVTKEKAKEVLDLAASRKGYIAFTSPNAVTSLDKYLHQHDTYYVVAWKIFCLEGKTKQAILNSLLSKENIISTAENAKALSKKIIEHEVKEMIFFCGNKRRNELPDILREAGINVHEVIVYETIEVPAIATDDIDGILFFSPSAVNSFFTVNKVNSKTVCFAIGETTANSIADFADNKIIIIETPSQEMMIASVNFYFQNINCYE